jgi:hypothetical protein
MSSTEFRLKRAGGALEDRALRKIFLLISSIAITSIAMIAFHVPQAKAATVEFDWSITSPSSSTELSGSGTLEATETTPTSGVYLVSTFSGTVNGDAVAIIGAGGFLGNDNDLYNPATTTGSGFSACGLLCQLDDNGLAFSVSNSNGTSGEVVIFESGNPMNTNCDTGGTFSPVCGQNSAVDPGYTTFSASPHVSATPLPAALPLFATGLGAMGLFGWRRKRKNASAIAAA